jgi:hypothetical protein
MSPPSLPDSTHQIGLAFDEAGNLYVSDANACNAHAPGCAAISKVTPTGAVSTFVTDIDDPFHNLFDPTGLAFGPDGTLYAVVFSQQRIYDITPSGSASIFASDFGTADWIISVRKPHPVPEPGTLALLGITCLVGVAGVRRQTRRRSAAAKGARTPTFR